MSGFKDDVLAILRDNVMLHNEAMGWIIGDYELLIELEDRKFPVTGKVIQKPVFLFDYIVITKAMVSVVSLLIALSRLSSLGMIIMDVSDWDESLITDYKSKFGNFTAHKLSYGDRHYLVIKQGVEYGN